MVLVRVARSCHRWGHGVQDVKDASDNHTIPERDVPVGKEPDKKVKEYTTAIYTFNVYVDWLEGLGKDVLEREMKKMRGDYSKGNLVAHKPLPGFKHCFDPLKD